MSIGLPNGKFGSGQSVQRLGLATRKHRVTTSIAEQAIFIPKPHKRVDFKLSVKSGVTLGSGKPKNEPIPLPGSKNGPKAKVADSMSPGQLGPNGLTARFGKAAWSGSPGGYVEVDVDMTPEKLRNVIATQEEGRQVNHSQIHFTQQYDSYGRPRIGFSREPYDFAATKYISTTSQIAFQSNMAKVHEQYDKYLLNGAGGEEEEVKIMGQEDDKSAEVAIFGATSDSPAGDDKRGKIEQEDMLGAKGQAETGPKKRSAKEAFEAQRVEVVEIFKSGPEEEPRAVDDLFKGGIDTESVRTLDVSA